MTACLIGRAPYKGQPNWNRVYHRGNFYLSGAIMGSNPWKIIIRPMRAEDIDQVAAIHCECFPDTRSTRLGISFVRKMYRWFCEKQPELAFVAEIDCQPIGFVTGAIGGSGRKIFRYAFGEVIGGFLRHPGLLLKMEMFEAWQSYLSGLFPRKRNTGQIPTGNETTVKAVLASIAVSPAGRGKKAGRALVSAFEEAARNQGATTLALGVEYDNSAARRLYEDCGWALTREEAGNNSANYIKVI